MIHYGGILLVGSVAQLIDGALGMGYGVTTSTLLLASGIYPVIVSSSIHTAKVFTSLSSGIAHFRMGNVRGDIFWPLTFFGVTGGVIGAYSLSILPIDLVRIVVSFVLLVLGLSVLCKFAGDNGEPRQEKIPPRRITPLAVVAGFIDAVGGGGWGPVCTPILMINGTEPRKVVGSVNLAEFFVAVAITGTFMTLTGLGNIPWKIVVPLVVAGVAVAPAAAWASKRASPRLLGMATGAAIIAMNLTVLLKLL